MQGTGVWSLVWVDPWRRRWHPTPLLLPGKSHGWRSLVGCSPWGREESDTTEWLHFHFSLSCVGEGNGNPLQCSCLENPRNGGAWWAAVYGVTQSRTRRKQLSSSSSDDSQQWEKVNAATKTQHSQRKNLTLGSSTKAALWKAPKLDMKEVKLLTLRHCSEGQRSLG